MKYEIVLENSKITESVWNLIERLNRDEIPYMIKGGPMNLTRKTCDKLNELDCSCYEMSLDGLRKTHDLLNFNGSFDLTLKGLKTLQKSGVKTGVSTNVSAANVLQIPWIIDEVVRVKADYYCLENLGRHFESLERMDILEKIRNKAIEYRNSQTLFIFNKSIFENVS